MWCYRQWHWGCTVSVESGISKTFKPFILTYWFFRIYLCPVSLEQVRGSYPLPQTLTIYESLLALTVKKIQAGFTD